MRMRDEISTGQGTPEPRTGAHLLRFALVGGKVLRGLRQIAGSEEDRKALVAVEETDLYGGRGGRLAGTAARSGKRIEVRRAEAMEYLGGRRSPKTLVRSMECVMREGELEALGEIVREQGSEDP